MHGGKALLRVKVIFMGEGFAAIKDDETGAGKGGKHDRVS